MQDVRGDDVREAAHVPKRQARAVVVASEVVQSIGVLAAILACLDGCVPDKLEQRRGSMSRPAICFLL